MIVHVLQLINWVLVTFRCTCTVHVIVLRCKDLKLMRNGILS